MPVPGLGHRSYLQIGKETTYGTAVAPTARFEIVSATIPPQVGIIQDASLNQAPARRAIYQGGLLYKGTFVVRVNYEGLEELFRAVFGATGYAGSVYSSPLNQHTYKESSILPSYTVELSIGDIPTGKVARYVGAKLTDLTIRATAGTGNDAMLMAEVTVLAKDAISDQNPGASLTAPAVMPVLFHQAVVADDGTADANSNIRMRGFELSLTQPHAEDRFYLTSVNPDEPVRSDFLQARWRLTQEYITKTQFDAARAFTTGSPRLLFRHPTAVNTGSPGSVSNVSAAGVFLITRSSGDFTSVVKVGSYLGVGAGVYFPVGTTVTAVTALQITVDQPSLTGPSYPASNQPFTFPVAREFEVRSGSANLSDFTSPVEGYGVLISTATWDAWYDATDLTSLFVRLNTTGAVLT